MEPETLVHCLLRLKFKTFTYVSWTIYYLELYWLTSSRSSLAWLLLASLIQTWNKCSRYETGISWLLVFVRLSISFWSWVKQHPNCTPRNSIFVPWWSSPCHVFIQLIPLPASRRVYLLAVKPSLSPILRSCYIFYHISQSNLHFNFTTAGPEWYRTVFMFITSISIELCLLDSVSISIIEVYTFAVKFSCLHLLVRFD
jgi:hypothetical protein